MRASQDVVFATGEGDKWFERNKAALDSFDPASDLPLKLVELFDIRPHATMEVGAANGRRLWAIHERYDCRVVAVEPSESAIASGRSRFPKIQFVNALANAIPLNDSFDLVILNAVFHWIGRANLLRSVAEVDRLLADGGFLIIGDFAPSRPTRVPYHHRLQQDVYTYKQNYADVFLASSLYHSVAFVLSDHAKKGALIPDTRDYDRWGVWLLRKTLEGNYVDARDVP
jgi:SAM-dependent methyltransferase